jgi:hypothetical protein
MLSQRLLFLLRLAPQPVLHSLIATVQNHEAFLRRAVVESLFQ